MLLGFAGPVNHAEVERKLARWTGRESALLFSTGYMASLATPLLGVLLAWGLLGEVPDLDEAIGIGLIAVALAGVLRPRAS